VFKGRSGPQLFLALRPDWNIDRGDDSTHAADYEKLAEELNRLVGDLSMAYRAFRLGVKEELFV